MIFVSGKVLLLVLCLFPWATGEECKAVVKVIPQMYFSDVIMTFALAWPEFSSVFTELL